MNVKQTGKLGDSLQKWEITTIFGSFVHSPPNPHKKLICVLNNLKEGHINLYCTEIMGPNHHTHLYISTYCSLLIVIIILKL